MAGLNMEPSKWTRHRKIFSDVRVFCETTGLHGYAYTTSGRNRFETVFWAVICLAALAWTTQICYDAFNFWEENPVSTM